MCTNCSNLSITHEQQSLLQQDTAIAEVALQETVMTANSETEDCDTEELMDWVFGETGSTGTVTDDSSSEDTTDDDDT